MAILFSFVLRLAFGLALAMALTSPRQVTSGYYRIHSYVLLGLFVLASLVAFSRPDAFRASPAVCGAVLSYLASVVWLYERPRAGIILLIMTSAVALCGAVIGVRDSEAAMSLWGWLDPATGGLVLGSTLAAMFLGHWYLNTPTMQLGPLRRLILIICIALACRALFCAVGLGWELSAGDALANRMPFLALRWFMGIVAPAVLVWMTWKTLDVPNTQSATGILYVAVVTTFTGELTSQLLSTSTTYPV